MQPSWSLRSLGDHVPFLDRSKSSFRKVCVACQQPTSLGSVREGQENGKVGLFVATGICSTESNGQCIKDDNAYDARRYTAFYEKLKGSRKDLIHWIQQLGLMQSKVRNDLKKLSQEKGEVIRDTKSNKRLFEFAGTYLQIFDVLWAEYALCIVSIVYLTLPSDVGC